MQTLFGYNNNQNANCLGTLKVSDTHKASPLFQSAPGLTPVALTGRVAREGAPNTRRATLPERAGRFGPGSYGRSAQHPSHCTPMFFPCSGFTAPVHHLLSFDAS